MSSDWENNDLVFASLLGKVLLSVKRPGELRKQLLEMKRIE